MPRRLAKLSSKTKKDYIKNKISSQKHFLGLGKFLLNLAIVQLVEI
jgi:hypothetical protein